MVESINIYYLKHFSVLTHFYKISFTGITKSTLSLLNFIFASNNKLADLFLPDIFLQFLSSSPPILPENEVMIVHCLVNSAGKLPRKKERSFLDSSLFSLFFPLSQIVTLCIETKVKPAAEKKTDCQLQ